VRGAALRLRSKDPSTQVGACIVNTQRQDRGRRVNGFPTGCSDDELPWARTGAFLETKYPYVVHARPTPSSTPPGRPARRHHLRCAVPVQRVRQADHPGGLREVVYLSDKYADTDPVRGVRSCFSRAVSGAASTFRSPLVVLKLDAE